MSDTAVNIAALYDKLENWRENKKQENEKIPNDIWHEIIALYKTFPEQARLCRKLGISRYQLKCKLQEFKEEALYNDPNELCNIPQIAPIKKQPDKTKKTTTSNEEPFSPLATIVVELCRPDKTIMKIHTTTQSVQEIITSFLGVKDATTNR